MAWPQCRSSISYLCVGVNWRRSGASVGQCRRQCYGCGTVFEPSRSRGRRHLKRTWSAGVRVGVTRERRAIPHERGSREGWGRARGARGRERLRVRRSAPREGARYYYLGSGSGSCYSQRHYVCHYLGVCGSDRDAATDAFFLSMCQT